MRKLVVISFLLIVGLNGFGQKSKKPYFEHEIPPGTMKVDTNLFMDKTEITNFMWLEYMYWTERVFGTTSNEYNSVLPDTTVWLNQDSCLHSYADYYLRYPSYRKHPLVGISQSQIRDYCIWRSDRVFEILLIRNKLLEHNPNQSSSTYFSIDRYFAGNYNNSSPNKDFNIVPHYRLPSVSEWKKAKVFYDSYELGYNKKCRKKWCDFHSKDKAFTTIFNIIPCHFDSIAEPTETVGECLYDKLIGFHFYGNVSEWLNENNRAIGGSWIDESKGNFNIPRNEEKQTSYIGSRTVCEWKEYKP